MVCALQQPRPAVGVPVSVVLVIATTVGVDPGYVAAHPESLAVPLRSCICVAAYLSALVTSDVRHRADSTLDQLTGLLNRRGLEPRFAEVAEQAALMGEPVSVVVADIDHFKRINDTHGHAVGDGVLRDVADAMRRSLRGSSCSTGSAAKSSSCCSRAPTPRRPRRIAETLRAAVENLPSVGAARDLPRSGWRRGRRRVAFASLVGAADEALYAAKRGGRNRVELAGGTLPAALAA